MAKPKSVDQKTKDFIDSAVKLLSKGIDADKHNREAAIDDLKFANPGDPQQWNQGTIQDRKADGRPYLTINLFPQYINQITGDIRHNRPRAKIHPDDFIADVHIARIREGIIADSEYQSNADYIYVEAGTMMATCGYGAWRIKTRYTEENPFIQEFYDELIENPFTVVMDPEAKDPIYSDANWGFIRSKIARADFEEKYPDAEVPGEQLKPGPGLTYDHWYDKDTVTVAEYFVRKKETVRMCQMDNGDVLTEEEAKKRIKAWEEKNKEMVTQVANLQAPPVQQPGIPTPGAMPPTGAAKMMPPVAPPMTPNASVPSPSSGGPLPPAPGGALAAPPLPPEPKIVKTRDTEVTKIKHYKLTAAGILSKNGLEGEDFPGRYIPIVLITGNRTNVEGKRYISGLVRNAKDPQKNVNYWYSAAAERIALEPKAPWIGTAKQFEGYEEDYRSANVRNFAMLKYNPDNESGALAPPPQRMGPGQVPTALFTQLQTSLSLFESAIGMNKSDLGAEGPERTGAAITARQKPGDIRTFSYIDNLARGIQHSAKIKNEMIPELYDTKRDVRIRGLDESETYVPINTTAKDAYEAIRSNPDRYRGMNTTKLTAAMQQHGPEARFNDIKSGRYAVKVTVGPSYATQRAEAAESLLRLTQAMPKQMSLAADLIAKNMDFKDADILSERLKRTLPPGLAQPTPGEPPAQPLPPSPQAQLMKQKVMLEQEKVKVSQMKVQVEKIKAIKELQGEKGEMKKLIMDVLAELHAPNHEADAMMGEMGGIEQ